VMTRLYVRGEGDTKMNVRERIGGGGVQKRRGRYTSYAANLASLEAWLTTGSATWSNAKQS